MKTSNKIITIAALVLIAWLVIYDNALKAEYVKGDFKKPHYHMLQLNFSNFNAIEHNVGNIIGIQVEKGPYGVWVNDYLKDKISISQNGQALVINYNGKENVNDYRGIIISCPDVLSITSNPFIDPARTGTDRYLQKRGNSMIIEYFQHGTISVIGFNQPVMNLVANQFTEFKLQKNTLGQLNAKVGDQQHGQAGLTIDADNNISTADLQVPGKSTLTLDNITINKLTYKVADSAEVTLTGKAVHLLDHQ